MDLRSKQKLLDNLYIKYGVALEESGINEEIIKGSGRIYSKLAIVGEAPFAKGDKGDYTADLANIIDALLIKKEDVYITSVVKFRPKAVSTKTGKTIGRPPYKDEVLLSAPFLFEELKIIEPVVAVTLGSAPLKAVTGDNSIKLKDFHGRLMEISRLTVYPLYNPKSLLYLKDLNEIYEKDLMLLKEMLGN